MRRSAAHDDLFGGNLIDEQEARFAPAPVERKPDPQPDPPRARASDPATSHVAAARAKAFAPTHCDQILGVLWRPMTCYRVAQLTGLTAVQVDRRLPELERDGLVRPTGATELGPNGSPCRLWEKVIARP